MEDDQIVTESNFNPAGEEVTPEPAAVVEASEPKEVDAEAPATPADEVEDEHSQEIAEIQAAVDAAETPEAKATQQKRLNIKFAEMRRERRDAKRAAEEARIEAAKWQGRAEAMAERGQVKDEDEAPVQPTPDLSGKPKEDAFEDYSEYLEALTDWKVEQKLGKANAERQAEEQRKSGDAWINKGAEKFKDFAEVVTKRPDQGGPAITPAMADAINSSDLSHELAYHLGKNVAESRRIAALPPMAAARELGKLEAKLTAPTVKPRIQTNAPAPIRPIAGDGATAITVDLEKLSEKDYIAEMNRREFGR